MSQNQRLIVAVVLSIVFFVAYTAIFPPVQPEVAQENKQSQSVQFSKDVDKPTIANTKTTEEVAGHSISQEEK
jgi:YidC/Oxa1 family membrane protein insertase